MVFPLSLSLSLIDSIYSLGTQENVIPTGRRGLSSGEEEITSRTCVRLNSLSVLCTFL